MTIQGPTLSDHLEHSKLSLFTYFDRNYAKADDHTLSSAPSSSVPSLPIVGSPQKSFMAQYHRKEKSSINKLKEYFKLPAKDLDTCNPIHWWMGWCAQFPNLFHLAHNILCIPGEWFNQPLIHALNLTSDIGSAVAIKRIFSGGWETISLHHASLQANTIHILMLACMQADTALHC